MNLKDTELENKRKQAIEALVADSTTLAERLLKAEDFGETCRILRGHDYCMERVMALIPERKPIIKEVAPMAQNSSPHYLCDYSAITIADKDAGITKITYSDTVEETPPDSPHKVVPFDFGRGPVPGYYVTSIQAEGAVIPDGSDVRVSYRRQGDEYTVCDTLRNVRQVRPGEYVCDWIYWDGMRPFNEAPNLYGRGDVA